MTIPWIIKESDVNFCKENPNKILNFYILYRDSNKLDGFLKKFNGRILTFDVILITAPALRIFDIVDYKDLVISIYFN